MESKELNYTQNDSENTEQNQNVINSENNSNELGQNQSEVSDKKETAADLILKKLKAQKEGEHDSEIVIQESTDLESLSKTLQEKFVEKSVQDEILEDAIETDEESDEFHEEETVSQVDYSSFTKEQLVNSMKELLNKSVIDIKAEVDSIRTHFYKLHKAEIAELKKAFIDNGGLEEEFKYEPDTLELELKDLHAKYRELKAKHNEEIELEKQKNLVEKYKIVEEIKNLINSQETMNKTFDEFKNLQKRWREIGTVPQTEVKALWDNYNHHIEKFYDFVKINRELRDLDLKKNLELKIELCEKAEELLLEPKIIKAFKELQKLHDSWRDIGPVPMDKKDEIWERFKIATTTINKKHQEFFEGLKQEQENNLQAKTLLCEKAEELANKGTNSHKDWEANSKEIIELQKIWKLIGFAPKKDNNKIYQRFRAACDLFFERKRNFYNQSKEEMEVNLQLKTDLCIQAESLKESTDWRKTTDIYINLQKQWKKVGPVPRKISDELWNRFRSACNAFFENKSKFFADINQREADNLQLKLALIEEVSNFTGFENEEDTLKQLKEFQKRWTEIGHVPIKQKDEVQKKFRDAIDLQFGKLRMDEHKRDDLRLKNRIENYRQSSAGDKVRAEKEKLRNKLEQLQQKLVLWENNLGFFTKSQNAESMIADFNVKIQRTKEQVVNLQKQIEFIEKAEAEMRKNKS